MVFPVVIISVLYIYMVYFLGWWYVSVQWYYRADDVDETPYDSSLTDDDSKNGCKLSRTVEEYKSFDMPLFQELK